MAMARFSLTAVLALTLAPSTFAVEKTVALEGLKQIAELKSMDMEDVICDECLEEIDCIWPCELACVLNVPEAFAGKVCEICLEYFGCEGCRFMCPSPDTDSPTVYPTPAPSVEPSFVPTHDPSYAPTATPAKIPTASPTEYPSKGPSEAPSPAPFGEPSVSPTYEPTTGPTDKPTASPTEAPSPVPSPGPTVEPTIWPTPKPTHHPTSAPTGTPTIPPTSTPTIPPTGAPTTTPEFYIYYSVEDTYLYAYNPITEGTELYGTNNYTGDLKVDSPNKFMFWSDPQAYAIYKEDMINGKVETLVHGKPVMGIAVDPSRGELYYANQGAGEENGFSGSAIEIIDYAGHNFSVVHDLEQYNIEPYAIECDPEFTISQFNLDDPGLILFTAHDGTEGFIYQANLFGGLLEKVYTTTTLDIFGLILDPESSMMWWIENRGVANGIYNAILEDTPESTYVTYLSESFWLAAVWDFDLMYATDYAEGTVYEMEVSSGTGEFENIIALAYVDYPRCLAFYYGGVTTEDGEDTQTLGGTAPHPLDAPQGAPGTASVALPDLEASPTTPAALLPPSDGDEAESLIETGSLSSSAPPTSTYLSVGVVVAGLVGAAVYARRKGTYTEIENSEEFSI